jgi:hypothetical protein
MQPKRRPRITYANVMSTVALMVALGGTSYAAINLPKNSVGSKQIKNGAVHSSDLAKNAVTNSKIAKNAVGTNKIADNAVTTSKIADNAVTAGKLAANSVTEAAVAPGSLTGAAFQCAPGDEGLDNRHECFFTVNTNGDTWFQAVALCRARGNTPATLASPAEIAAAAVGGGSPFTTGTFWTSQIASGQPVAGNSTIQVAQTLNGTLVGLPVFGINSTTIGKAACVYHAADES